MLILGRILTQGRDYEENMRFWQKCANKSPGKEHDFHFLPFFDKYTQNTSQNPKSYQQTVGIGTIDSIT